MRFAFTEDQLMFRDVVRDLLAKECPPEVVRAAWPADQDKGEGARAADGDDAVANVWARLAEMGVLGVAVPEELGGLGMNELDWVLLAEATGYAALPFPFVESVCVAGPLLAASGDPGSRVAELVAGDRLVTARLLGDGPVPFGQSAGDALLLADGRISLVDLSLVDDAASPLDGVDGSRGLVALPVWPDSAALAVTDEPALIDLAVDRGALGTAAQLLGLSQRMLDLTVAYVSERKQFGVPIGSFQAVKHHLADALMQLEFARPAVYRAAYSSAHDLPSRGRDVSMAKAMASDAARFVGAQALQCHGAIGYTVEYDLHLYLKRAWALAASWGDSAWHRNRVGNHIGVNQS